MMRRFNPNSITQSSLSNTFRPVRPQIAAAAGTGDRLRPTPSQERSGRAGSRTASPAPAAEPARSEGSATSPERAGAPTVLPDSGDLSDEEVTYYDREGECREREGERKRLADGCCMVWDGECNCQERKGGQKSGGGRVGDVSRMEGAWEVI